MGALLCATRTFGAIGSVFEIVLRWGQIVEALDNRALAGTLYSAANLLFLDVPWTYDFGDNGSVCSSLGYGECMREQY